MTRAAIFYCKKIKDHSCIGCCKCFKAIKEKNGQYGNFDSIDVVSMTDCGDCPGLLVPRVKMITQAVAGLEREPKVIFLGTCMKLATETGGCTLDLNKMQKVLEEKTGKQVIIGTHDY